MYKSMTIGALLLCSIAGSVAFAALYALGAGTQAAGISAAVAAAGLAAALVLWERSTSVPDNTVEEREPLASAPAARRAALDAFDGAGAVVRRRWWLVWLAGGAFGALAAAALFPLRSLTPPIGDRLARTAWRPGVRLVRSDGTPLRADELVIDSVVTAFPEGATGENHLREMANAAVMLVRVPAAELALSPDRAGWAPLGCVAYSKVCTHAGCPVGLYRAAARQLFCPCHQSTFDVLRDGNPIFGPAARALPQLPIGVRKDGYLIAQSDFPEPVGPGYWDRP